MKIYLKIILALFLILLMPININAQETVEDQEIIVHYFYSSTCTVCREVTSFLDEYLVDKDYVTLVKYNVLEGGEYEDWFIEVTETFNRENLAYPYIIIGGKDLQGLYEIKADIDKVINYYLDNPNYSDIVEKIKDNQVILPSDFLTEDFDGGRTVTLPIIGEIELASFSLLLGAVFIGLIDGFNPCAMWILVFLITMLINLKDRKKMWILGLTFILTSGIVYYVIMMSWLQLVIQVALIKAFQIIIGVLALVFAFISLRHFNKQRKLDTGCEVTSIESKRKLIVRAKKVINNNNLWLAILGIAGIAITVNVIELACSAGLPVIYTSMLAYNDLSQFQSAMYILVYVIFFMFDDLLIFTLAVITFKVTGVSSKYAKYSNLFGGIIMLVLGVILIFFPQILL
ncbi:MAG: hypothetical protein RBQ64_02295 [Candidatus Izemoplasmatales bacterium]|jgi:hypothetical protein|nr:hypothetical protein [Candidatus Izemoplasmatales bacterium]